MKDMIITCTRTARLAKMKRKAKRKRIKMLIKSIYLLVTVSIVSSITFIFKKFFN